MEVRVRKMVYRKEVSVCAGEVRGSQVSSSYRLEEVSVSGRCRNEPPIHLDDPQRQVTQIGRLLDDARELLARILVLVVVVDEPSVDAAGCGATTPTSSGRGRGGKARRVDEVVFVVRDRENDVERLDSKGDVLGERVVLGKKLVQLDEAKSVMDMQALERDLQVQCVSGGHATEEKVGKGAHSSPA
jgi:hypothetical protein